MMQGLLQDIVKQADGDSRVLAVLLFGSTAPGDRYNTSNVDVCLVLEPGTYLPEALMDIRLQYLAAFAADISMTGNEFIRRVRRLGCQRGLRVVFVPERGKGSHGTFEDLPEAITQGADTTDALRQGADCLEEAIAGRIRRHDEIPEPSPIGLSSYAIPLSAQMAAKAALYQAGITQVELAARLHCDEKEVRRLLPPRHASKLACLEFALAVLGQQLVVNMQAAL